MKLSQFPVRSVLFFTFVIGFFVSAPIVVLYTAGYRYNFETGRILHTGIISVISEPKNTDIFLDEVLIGKSPIVLKNIVPGNHKIKITTEEYYSWEADFRVESRATTFITPTLLKRGPRETIYNKKNDQILSYTKNSKMVIKRKIKTTEDSHDYELVYIDTANNLEKTILSSDSNNILEDLGSVLWSPDENFFTLLIEPTTEILEKKISSFDTKTGTLLPLEDFFTDSSPIIDLWYDQGSEHDLYIRRNDGVWKISFDNQPLKLTGPDSIIAGIHNGNKFIVLQKADSFMSVGYIENNTTKVISYLPINSEKDTYSIKNAPGNRLLIEQTKDQNKHLFIINPNNTDQPIEYKADGSLATFSTNGQKMLYANEFEIVLVDLNSHEKQILTRSSQSISSLDWHPSEKWVLFVEANKLTAFELYPFFDQRKFIEILKSEQLNTTINKETKKIILLVSDNNQESLEQVEL